MKACGLIVEYNPFHNGHLYHVNEAKKRSNADCMIAVMSGSFLQRGEPAIIDKFHRAEAALSAGVDIVIELPYPYAVQSSHLFARGAVLSLKEIGVNSICFGSEAGTIKDFTTSFHLLNEKKDSYQTEIKRRLKEGLSFPKASEYAFQKIGLKTNTLDLTQPNNILGFSYVQTILANQLQIQPFTIKRTKSNYHDEQMKFPIASATSIRKELVDAKVVSEAISKTLPIETVKQMEQYKDKSTMWHTWENYFPLLHYRVMTMKHNELAMIHGVDEGLENRIKQTAKLATSFNNWMKRLKTKRYTWTRLQRTFVHILTNTQKMDFQTLENNHSVPYLRLLGATKTGRSYLNKNKKEFSVPLINQLQRNPVKMLAIEENATNAYYSILPVQKQIIFKKQEMKSPIFLDN